MTEQTFQMHVMPSVFVLETTMPQSMIDSVNDYMDEYKEKKDKQSLKHSDESGQETTAGKSKAKILRPSFEFVFFKKPVFFL